LCEQFQKTKFTQILKDKFEQAILEFKFQRVVAGEFLMFVAEAMPNANLGS